MKPQNSALDPKRFFWTAIFIALLLAFALPQVSWAEDDSAYGAAAKAAERTTVDYDEGYTGVQPSIETTFVDDYEYLFLPSYLDYRDVCISVPYSAGEVCIGPDELVYEGSSLNLATFLSGVDETTFDVVVKDSTSKVVLRTIRVMRSSALSSIFITSTDPENFGRSYIESSKDHSLSATGSMVMVAEDGTSVYDGGLTQIKGRGNSTWTQAKKPYQIKLSSKADLLRTGDKANKNKTWVLLANAMDQSLIRNSIVSGIAGEIGLGYTQSESVDLYYDGEYRGNYLLCEKVQVNSGRVEITDLEDANAEANPDVELDELGLTIGKNDRGNDICYSEGMASPEDYTGGYLFERDNRYSTESAWFAATIGSTTLHFTVKSPEVWSYKEANYLSCKVQDIFDAITANRDVSDIVDTDSLAKLYWINELTKNNDGFTYASTYFYIDKGEGSKLVAGPAWDFDLSLGQGASVNKYRAADGLYTWNYAMVVPMMANNSIYAAVVRNADSVFEAFSKWTTGGGIDVLSAEVRASQAMDSVLWWKLRRQTIYETYDDTIAALKDWSSARIAWFDENYPTGKISTQPSDAEVHVGSTATFSLSANFAVAYQWQYSIDGTSWYSSGYTGNKSNTLEFNVTLANARRSYRCMVTYADGTQEASEVCHVNLAGITGQPENASASVGDTVEFKVATSGAVKSYQWQYSSNGTSWHNSGYIGYASDTLKVKVSASNSGRLYRCVVVFEDGTTEASDSCCASKAEITGQPENVSASVGDTVEFKVATSGAVKSYQWQYSSNRTSWHDSGYIGYASNTLRVKVSPSNIGRQYRCVIVFSNGAEMTSGSCCVI